MLMFALATAQGTSQEGVKLLPDRIGDFHALSVPRPFDFSPGQAMEHSAALNAIWREYASASGKTFRAGLIKARTDSAAYAFLTDAAQQMQKNQSSQTTRVSDVGTTAFASPGRVAFFKGQFFVVLDKSDGRSYNDAEMLAFSRLLAETLDRGEGEIPVLVKHLPDWEHAQERAAYAVSLSGLERVVGQQPVLEAVSFEGGTEAVTSEYGPSRLVIVEYTTPQIARDSDATITERIKQLQGAGQPVPSAYRRVGNYSVFVFDAPDERAAAQLMDQISYEQVVQWLGTNPHILERAQREYVNTMGNTILAVLKASGLSLILCFGIGGLVGALVFKRRRAQAASVEAYSDAGGMLRLNIDEMTRHKDPGRLLGRGEG
jgi:hypothetical protein